ncbi:MAG TPA: DUF3500 domain-containing protein [Cyclobacteriaceae bacterium]|nr:DUF3500 domain-containing protein [Cyclobacteriaceae bacterium]
MKTKVILFAAFLLLGFISSSAQDLAKLANEFLNTLEGDVKARAQFSVDDAERFHWDFVPVERKGPTFHDFNDKQTKAAWALLKASLSSVGYQKSTAIVANEDILREVEGLPVGNARRDPKNYHFLIFGTPSVDKEWMWRFEGHHCSLSFAVVKNQIVSSTPSFFGANPGIVRIERAKGQEILKAETDLAFALIRSLNESQLKSALFSEKALPEIISLKDRKAKKLSPEGIAITALNESQRKAFLQLLDVFVKNYEFGFSKKLMEKIKAAGMDNLTFAWAGSLKDGEGNYYRIQGPMLLIEYDNTQNNNNHVHTVVRDLTNDFAEDILREHYQKDHTY